MAESNNVSGLFILKISIKSNLSFLNPGFVARCLMDEYKYKRSVLYMTEPEWYPIFEPDASMLSSIGDGAIKLNQAVPGYMNKDNLEELTGFPSSQLDPIESGEQ